MSGNPVPREGDVIQITATMKSDGRFSVVYGAAGGEFSPAIYLPGLPIGAFTIVHRAEHYTVGEHYIDADGYVFQRTDNEAKPWMNALGYCYLADFPVRPLCRITIHEDEQ